jgi:dTDP-4-dehydrorhamnose 3,5-epimerase
MSNESTPRAPRFSPTDLSGVVIIDPVVHRDHRGFFVETHNAQLYAAHGITHRFVQDNASRSGRNTLRGLHAQVRRPQAKLIRVVAGEIFDVAVDIRRGSPSFGQWVGTTLSADNFRQMFIPPGFAHGFCVMSEEAEVVYKVSDFYDPGGEIVIAYNDPAIGISWPTDDPVVSDRDAHAPTLAALGDGLPRRESGT